jgi:hypothetical protein
VAGRVGRALVYESTRDERLAVDWLELHAAQYRLALADWVARPRWQQ